MSAQAVRVQGTSVRRARSDDWLASLTLALLAVLVLAIGFLYLRQASAVATGGYDILRQEAERTRLEIANSQLSYKLVELSSMARLEREARDTLKMAPPKETLHLRVPNR
ncbi:MAG: hypothetical protein ACYC4L_00190 [Chloroflexota bacterium]